MLAQRSPVINGWERWEARAAKWLVQFICRKCKAGLGTEQSKAKKKKWTLRVIQHKKIVPGFKSR